jgi:adenosylcobinamide-GDP ribazoletransferase
MRDFLNALRFLTVLPLPAQPDYRETDLPRSMFFFPAAGLFIAALSYLFYQVADSFFPAPVSAFALLLAPVLITGGLHVDGFADFCDGFFGGREKSDVLRIMKDSRVGAWGALGVALLMILKFELLKALPFRAPAFFLAMAASRCAQVWLSASLHYAGTGGGMGESVARKTGRRELIGASAFTLMPVLWFPKEGILILAALVPSVMLLGMYFKKRIGGMTGDLYGAASELTEIFVFLAATAIGFHEA